LHRQIPARRRAVCEGRRYLRAVLNALDRERLSASPVAFCATRGYARQFIVAIDDTRS